MKATDLVWLLVMGVVVAASSLMASRRSSTPPVRTETDRAIAVEPADGTNPYRVRLSEPTAARLGIETAAHAQVIPYSALLYDARGDTWVYTNPEAMVFVRHRVHVDRIDGNRVLLADGPPAGTAIVTVGGAELLAAELGQ